MKYQESVLQIPVEGLNELENYSADLDALSVNVVDRCDEQDLSRIDRNFDSKLTIITENASVAGNIVSDQSVSLIGRIDGDIKATGNVEIAGVIVGNIKAENVIFDKSKVSGNTSANSDISVKADSVIVGDLSARNVIVNGRVKGAISAAVNSTFSENAVVIGEIKTVAISVSENAMVNANITLVTDNVSSVSEDMFEI